MARKPLHPLVLLTGLALAVVPAAGPVAAQTASLVRDVNTVGYGLTSSSGPRQLLAFGRRIFFVAGEPTIGSEPWTTDGTANGTELLGDLCPGDCDSEAEPIAALGGRVLFVARDAASRGPRLWTTDGTRAGTVALTAGGEAIEVGQPSRSWRFVILGGQVYFRACTAAQGCEPWVSDGTAAGTRILADTAPGAPSGGGSDVVVAGGKVYFPTYPSSPSGSTDLWAAVPGGAVKVVHLTFQPRFLTAAGSRLFFVGPVSGLGNQLWTSDGTAAGTRSLSSLPATGGFGDGAGLVPLGGQVYFVADDVVHGSEIWTSDGTVAGTRRVTDFGIERPFGEYLDHPPAMALLGTRLLFFASDGLSPFRLWKTDGTPESTAPVADGPSGGDGPLVTLGTRVLFVAEEPVHGRELWASDGTAAGTVLLREACPGSCDSVSAEPAVAGAFAYFVATDPAYRQALWRTDGTAAGTRRFVDLDLDYGEPYQSPRVALLGNRLYFTAGDDTYGSELWSSDGRPGGTRLVTDLVRGAADAEPFRLTPFGGGIAFTACSDLDRQVWTSDGSAAGTAQLTAGNGPPCQTYNDDQLLATAGGKLFFLHDDEFYNPQLWVRAGAGAPAVLTNFTSDPYIPELVVAGDRVYFSVNNEVWVSDGTPGGTREAFGPTGEDYAPSFLTPLGADLYFAASRQQGGNSVWKSDGTQAGTVEVLADAGHYGSSVRPGFTRVGAVVYFVAGGEATGAELWRSDGTPGGTRIVADLLPGFGGSLPAELTELGGRLYFFTTLSTGGHGFWRSDGTAAGTVQLAAFPNVYAPPPQGLTALGGRLFFSASDDAHGAELWASDGTAAGTVLVADVVPGPRGSSPAELTAAGGRLFFAADDGVHGVELWQSDGTAAGTRLVQDVAPGPRSASPRELAATAGRLFWSADDGLTGRELWSLPLAGPGGCLPAPGALCLGGGRFKVEVDWRTSQGATGTGQAVPLTADTGAFWFFSSANLELVVKVLDGRGLNGHFWVFYGALSNVEYTLTVTDTQTGASHRYFNPAGQFGSYGDTRGFGPLGAYATQAATRGEAPGVLALASERSDPAAATLCHAGPTRLCLVGGRFAVEAAWKDFQGKTGAGQARGLTADTGTFWFFNPENLEVVVKLVDGRPVNGKYWFFYGALSNVEYTLTVTDTQTGAVRTYKNPSGRFASAGDTGAF